MVFSIESTHINLLSYIKKMKKTQRWLRLPLPEEAHHILSKLHAKNGDTPYFFAHLSPHHLGEHLEVWLELRNIAC